MVVGFRNVIVRPVAVRIVVRIVALVVGEILVLALRIAALHGGSQKDRDLEQDNDGNPEAHLADQVRWRQERGPDDRPQGSDDEHEEPTAEEREDAVKRLKTFLIMEGLRKKVSVEVTDEEFEGYLADRSRQLGMQLDKLKRSPRAADLRRDLEEDKIFAYLEEHAMVEERAV